MDKNKKTEVACANLEFVKSQSTSKQAKIQEFWKYLESQDKLRPYEVPKIVAKQGKAKDSAVRDTSSSSETSSSTKSCKTTPKKKLAKEKKTPVKSELSKLEKYFREDLRYADSVEVSYDEINAEIEDYQRRLVECNCKNKECDCQKKKLKKFKTVK